MSCCPQLPHLESGGSGTQITGYVEYKEGCTNGMDKASMMKTVLKAKRLAAFVCAAIAWSQPVWEGSLIATPHKLGSGSRGEGGGWGLARDNGLEAGNEFVHPMIIQQRRTRTVPGVVVADCIRTMKRLLGHQESLQRSCVRCRT